MLKFFMSSLQTKTLSVFAPAKINLYLHVTGRLDNGYHTLDSLIAFADTGDSISIEAASDFAFQVDGPSASAFNAKELDSSPNSSNIAVRAAWALARAAQKTPNLRIKLTKNLPLASGLGGGSADAAAVVWGLCEWWGIPRTMPYLADLMIDLGADVPVCFSCKPTHVRGIGDILEPAPALGEVPILLVNPGTHCPTSSVFKGFRGRFREPTVLPASLHAYPDLLRFLGAQDNDLEMAAMDVEPMIGTTLEALRAQKGCDLARMSGSGATCFGLFESEHAVRKAAEIVSVKNPGWWVKPGWLNRPERY